MVVKFTKDWKVISVDPVIKQEPPVAATVSDPIPPPETYISLQ